MSSEQQPAKERFAGYAKLELMGHLSFEGFVEEVDLFGVTVIAIDPFNEFGEKGARSYFSAGSLYRLTPLDEQEIRGTLTKRRAWKARHEAMLRPPQITEASPAVILGATDLCHQCFERPANPGQALCTPCFSARYGESYNDAGDDER